MQIGNSWTVGAAAPASLDAGFLEAISTIETELRAQDADTSLWRWTLTFLEGLPVVELTDGTVIKQGYQGEVQILWAGATQPDSDEDW